MLTLRKNAKRIEVAKREIIPYVSRDLLYAFLIALLLHILPISLFTIKKLYFSYSDPIIQAITIAPSLQQLEISANSSLFPPPRLAKYEPLKIPPIHPISARRLLAESIKPYALTSPLYERLIEPSPPPETAFVKLKIKVDDKTGKVFYYEAVHPLSNALHDWVMTLEFEKKSGSFVTTGYLEIDTEVKHD